MISSTRTSSEDMGSLPPRRTPFESPASMTEACELARRLVDVIEHLRMCAPEGDQAQALRLAEGMARNVADVVTDVLRSRRAHVA
jgi:hypothetical protein